VPSEEFMTSFTEQAITWVRQQRNQLRPNSKGLTQKEKRVFSRFFDQDLLDSARFAHVPVIKNPDFYKGFNSIPLLDLEQVVAFTFIDTVAEIRNSAIGTKFHELVHVEQFRQLGVERTVALYLKQWVNGDYDYWNIELEEDASGLVAWYHSNPQESFSVSEEVAKRLETYKLL